MVDVKITARLVTGRHRAGALRLIIKFEEFFWIVLVKVTEILEIGKILPGALQK